MSARKLKFKLTYEPDTTVVHLTGDIDEHVGDAISEIRAQVRGKRCVFDCDAVGHINSIGVSIWLAHISAYVDVELAFVRCPYSFTSLCLIIPDLAGGGKVESLYVRYLCARCKDNEHMVLAERGATLANGRFPPLGCPRCKTPMEVEADDADFIEVFRGVE